MYQHLDDPVALPASTREQRQATVIRGDALRRRRRAVAVAIPLGAAAVAAAVAGVFALSADPTRSTAPVPASSPTRSAVLPLGVRAAPADGAFGGCSDPVGDSVGDPDLTGVGLDRPAFPFIHYTWTGGGLPRTGSVEALFWATSADGRRSRQLVVEIVDGKVVDQFVRDPDTGVEQTVVDGASAAANGAGQRAQESSADGLGAAFPAAAFSPLRDGWTFVASIKVDGAVVDSCDGKNGSTMGP